MYKPKATSKEKAMDDAIAETRRPYDYRITKKMLDAAAKETYRYLRKSRLG